MKSEQIDITTPEHVSLKFHLAGLGSRGAAHIIDWLILLALFFSGSFGLIKLGVDFFPFLFETVSGYVLAAIILALFFLFWGYFILFEFFLAGRTPGKMLIGIRVIQDNGQSITFLSSVLRNVLRVIDLLPTLYLLGILMIFFHSKHKRIGDLAAGTIIIYEKKRQRNKRKAQLEKEIERRGVQANRLSLDEWTKKKFGSREWNLLKTYMIRRSFLTSDERKEMTLKVAGILFPLFDSELSNQPIEEIENDLFALYLLLKEDWEYEI